MVVVAWLSAEWAWQAVILVAGLASLSCGSDANLLDTMLLRSGRREESDGPLEESSSTATLSAKRCHCYPQCPDGSFNNTCMTNGFCFAMVTREEGGHAVFSTGCLALAGSEFQCKDTLSTRSQRALQCCGDHDYCNRKLHPTLPPLITSGSLSHTVKLAAL